jgi:hypothetical protein
VKSVKFEVLYINSLGCGLLKSQLESLVVLIGALD